MQISLENLDHNTGLSESRITTVLSQNVLKKKRTSRFCMKHKRTKLHTKLNTVPEAAV